MGAGVLSGDDDESQLAHLFDDLVAGGRRGRRQPDVIRVRPAQPGKHVIQIGDKKRPILRVLGGKQIQRSGNRKFNIGKIPGRAHRQPQRVADNQAVPRQKVAVDQDMIRPHRQPVHQAAQGFVAGKIGAIEGNLGKIHPVHAQQPPRLLPPADAGRSAVIAYPRRRPHAGRAQMLRHRQKQPARFVV